MLFWLLSKRLIDLPSSQAGGVKEIGQESSE
jgi:hypothetical protein